MRRGSMVALAGLAFVLAALWTPGDQIWMAAAGGAMIAIGVASLILEEN